MVLPLQKAQPSKETDSEFIIINYLKGKGKLEEIEQELPFEQNFEEETRVSQTRGIKRQEEGECVQRREGGKQI